MRTCYARGISMQIQMEKDSLLMWDNRIVQHAALNDYVDYDRTLYRVTVNGTKLN